MAPHIGIAFICILSIGCGLVLSQHQPYPRDDPNIDPGEEFNPYPGEFNPYPGEEFNPYPDHNGGDNYEDHFQQFLEKIPFGDMVKAFADILYQDTIKKSLSEACTHAKRIMDVIISLGTGPDPIKVDDSPPIPGGIPTSPNSDSDPDLDSFCVPIEEAASSGKDVKIYKEICSLLELANPTPISDDDFNIDHVEEDVYIPEGEHNQHDQHCEGTYIEISDGYKWLFNSLLLLTFDNQWSSEWRYYITSPHQLVDEAFKQGWESGMDCGILRTQIQQLTGKQFIDQAIRRVFLEILRDYYYPKVCGEHSHSSDEVLDKDMAFKRKLIDETHAYLFGKECTTLQLAFSERDKGKTDQFDGILDNSVSKYYKIIAGDTDCKDFLQSVIGSYPNHVEAIANYTGYSGGIEELCGALKNANNPEAVSPTTVESLSQYGSYNRYCDGSTSYKHYLSLSSMFLAEGPVLSTLYKYCQALNDLHGEDQDLCKGLKEAYESENHENWGTFATMCERNILQRYDHEAWRRIFHGNRGFSVIFSSFFLFTFNGDWDMPYRKEIVAITKYLRQSFDLWQNYDQICQNVNDALTMESNVLIKNAIKTSFRSYIRNRLSRDSCTQPNPVSGATDKDLYNSDPDKQVNVILSRMFQFLLSYTTKEEMCSALLKATDINSFVETATTSYLSLFEDNSQCQSFFAVYTPEFTGFHDALRKFTGFSDVQEFCGYLVDKFSNPQEDKVPIYDNIFLHKHMQNPYDVYLDNGYVFEEVHFKDIISVASRLYNSPTVQNGLNLLCENFGTNLDFYRIDADICDSVKPQASNFLQSCQMYKWLTEDFGPERKRYTFPWIEFERWLPDWFYDYSGFDHIFYMYFDWRLEEPIALDLSQMLSDTIGFPIPDTHGTCNRLTDSFRDQEMFRNIIDGILERTMEHLANLAPVLCLEDDLPFPKEPYNTTHGKDPTSSERIAYDQTHWKHVHIGPIDGPLTGKVFAYLAGFLPVSDMCSVLRSTAWIDREMLKRVAIETISKLRTNETACQVFGQFVDNERRQAYGDVPTLAEKMGFDSTKSMCSAIVSAFEKPTDFNGFNWVKATMHYQFYHPDEWVPDPKTPGEVLPGVTYHEMIQLIGYLYSGADLRSGVQSICRILDIPSYANAFPFESELCNLARDLEYDSNFQEYCYKTGSQYDTYNDYPGFPKPGFPEPGAYEPGSHEVTHVDDHYEEHEEWHLPIEILTLFDFAKGHFGLDISNVWSICGIAGDLLTKPIPDLIDEMKIGISIAIQNFLQYRHELYCYKDNGDTSKTEDFPIKMISEVLAVLANFDTPDEFCSHIESILPQSTITADGIDKVDICSQNPTLDSSLQEIASRIISTALNIIEDHTTCSSFMAIFYEYFSEYIEPAIGHKTPQDLCTMLVDSFTKPPAATTYKPPVIPANVEEIFEGFEPFKEQGQLLPFLTVNQAIEFVGVLYNKPTPRAILAYLCETYKSTLDLFDMEELDPLKQSCEIIKEGNIVPFCEQQLVPLMYGQDYPVGLRQVNVPFELQRIVLSLGGEMNIMNNQAMSSAIEKMLNSQMSARDLADEVMDKLLPKVIRATTDICNNWDVVMAFLNQDHDDGPQEYYYPPDDRRDSPPKEDNDEMIDKIFDFAGVLSGYATTEGRFDCRSILTEDPKKIAKTLKRKIWCYAKNVDQCVAAFDATKEFIKMISGGEADFTDATLKEFLGFSTGIDMCQAIVGPIAACTKEYRPLCGTDGMTYDNHCLLETAQCKDPTLEIEKTGECNGDCAKICTEIYRPICGTDGKIYSNKCFFEVGQCRDPKLDIRNYGECRDCETIICTKEYRPLCGSDGKTYSSKCPLEIANCKDPTIEMQSEGPCEGDPGQCPTITDCAGVCGGSAEEDCLGVCKGTTIRDCSGECGGTAELNDCGYCVGGNTRQVSDFGRDACGNCRVQASTYQLNIDCAGECDGTAFLDACRECVGGKSGNPVDKNSAKIDCSGMCNGDWVEDACGICGPPDTGPYGSKFRDCSETCYGPGSDRSTWAWMNECEECVGGSTTKTAVSGINACDICGNDESSCTGCDGVANSGKVEDACKVCDGDGTTCTTVASVQPLVVPTGETVQFQINGAGFTNLGQGSVTCVFQPNVHGTRVEVAGKPNGPRILTCENTAQLTPDLYDVTVQVGGKALEGNKLRVAVYNAGTMTMSPDSTILTAGSVLVRCTTSGSDFEPIKNLLAEVPSLESPIYLDIKLPNGDVKTIPGLLPKSSNNELIFSVDYIPPRSTQVKMLPKLGNYHLQSPQGQGFSFTFKAQPPQFAGLKFDDSGAKILANFKPGVKNRDLDSCDDIFADVTALGTSPKCSWISPKELAIEISKRGLAVLINVGDTLMLKPNALYTFKEDYSDAASGSRPVSAPSNPVKPSRPLIRGNAEIASCGTLLLSARGSNGGGGRVMTYQWSVCDGPDYSAVQFTSPNPRTINIVGTQLQVDQDYKLCMAVSNFLGGTESFEMIVRRSSKDRPEARIIAQGVDVKSVPVSKRFILEANVKFTDCFPPIDIVYEWSVNRDDILMNLKTRRTSALLVEANTLPGDSEIEFTLRVSKATDKANYVERSIKIMTKYSPLQPVLNLPRESTVGRQSKALVLDASKSIDPDEVPVKTMYTWQCVQILPDNTACFRKGGEGATLLKSEDIERDAFAIDPLQMFPGVTYKFTVEISKGTRWATASVLVNVIDGKLPEVIVLTDTKTPHPVEKRFQLDAVIKTPDAASNVDKITWMFLREEGYGYADITQETDQPTRSFDNGYTSRLRIEPGTLSPDTKYLLQISACIKDICNKAIVEIKTLPTVTSCVLSIEGGHTYTALDLVTFNIDDCVTSSSAYPLSYQLYRHLDTKGSLEPITEEQAIPTFETIGKGALAGTTRNTFEAKVCNIYDVCEWFRIVATVSPVTKLTTAKKAELNEKLVETEKKKKKFLNALVNYNVINGEEQQSAGRRRKRSEELAPAQVQLDLIQNCVEFNVLIPTSLQLLIEQFDNINMADLSFHEKGVLLDVIIELMETYKDPIPPEYAKTILKIIGQIAQDLIPEQLPKIRKINSKLGSSRVKELALGGGRLETISDQVASIVEKVIPKGIFRSKSGNKAAAINFGAEIERRFGHLWSCSSGDTCSGVVIKYEHFDTAVDFFSKKTEDRNFRAADIISIAFSDPDSDEEISVKDLAEPIEINITITLPQGGMDYQCRYWSESNEEWKSDGLETVKQADDLVSCLTNHLTQFTVMGVEPKPDDSKLKPTEKPPRPTTQNVAHKDGKRSNLVLIIVIVVVVLLIIVIVLLVVIIVCVKKTQNKIVPANNEPQPVTQHQEYGKHSDPPPPYDMSKTPMEQQSGPPPPAVVSSSVEQPSAPPPPALYSPPGQQCYPLPPIGVQPLYPQLARPPSRSEAGLADIST